MLKSGWKRTAVLATASVLTVSAFFYAYRQTPQESIVLQKPVISKSDSVPKSPDLPVPRHMIKNSKPVQHDMGGPKLKMPLQEAKSAVMLDSIPQKSELAKNEAPPKKEEVADVKAKRDSVLNLMFEDADRRVARNFTIISQRPERQTYERAMTEHGLAVLETRLYLAALMNTEPIGSIKKEFHQYGEEKGIQERVNEILRIFDSVMGTK